MIGSLNFFAWFQSFIDYLCKTCTRHEAPTTHADECSNDEPTGCRPTQQEFG